MNDKSDLADRLSTYLGGPVSDFDILVGGASREMYRFTFEGRQLVLRKDPPGASAPAGARALELQCMQAAFDAGVPVPEPLDASDDSAHLGAPFVIMALVEGETIPRRILREDAYAELRANFAGECGRILARLHTAPPPAGLRRPEPTETAAAFELRLMESQLDLLAGVSGRYPALELGLRWLRAHPPPSGELALVHGDFRLGNLMVGPDRIRAVLDWEVVHVGDPVEDLGWLCVRAWRFGNDDLPVGGCGAREDLLAAYQAEAGCRVDPAHLRWWEIFRTLWWGVGCGLQASRFLLGHSRNIELAALGRRISEQEYDLLELVAEAEGA